MMDISSDSNWISSNLVNHQRYSNFSNSLAVGVGMVFWPDIVKLSKRKS